MMRKVVFLGMGGTIAGRAADAADNIGYKAGEVQVQALLQNVPGLQQALAGAIAESEQVAQLDSSDLCYGDWVRLAKRVQHFLGLPDVQGIVVTHGTDTLEETAYFLARVLPAELTAQKPVVLTCAMRPASALAPDGPGNLRDAAVVAVGKGPCGVVAVCAGRIHSALHVRKVHPYRLDPFDSGDASPIGFVEEGRVRLMSPWPAFAVPPVPPLGASWNAANVPWVELVHSHAGASSAAVLAMCAQRDAQLGPLKGIVVASTGNGTIHRELKRALLQARDQGVRVVRVTRCAEGQIVASAAAAVTNPADAPFEAWGLPPVKARIELVLQILAHVQ